MPGAAFRLEALRSFDGADEDGTLFEQLAALEAAEKPTGPGRCTSSAMRSGQPYGLE